MFDVAGELGHMGAGLFVLWFPLPSSCWGVSDDVCPPCLSFPHGSLINGPAVFAHEGMSRGQVFLRI